MPKSMHTVREVFELLDEVPDDELVDVLLDYLGTRPKEISDEIGEQLFDIDK